MRQFSGPFLALIFVSFILLSLWSIKPTWDTQKRALSEDEQRVSEIGLRVSYRH